MVGSERGIGRYFRQRPLNFSTPIAATLYQAINEIVPVDFDAMIAKLPTNAEEENRLPSWKVKKIAEAAKEFETVLRNECQMMDTYFVSKKGTHSTKDLIENAHHQVP
jgi:hypothetical protein